ncbi:type III pantothenate kinase [Flaviaesturariibacter flavus]|uniref:Type III pantothenate kinase n=1 Tax=Flaviaesturariibacter flavus TaxID=2502780 RepID=A0A4R1BI96_9BACT|nr:type III pantothenate kinase [Flaviaesturariibacter flavus]TCJ13096.1 type III pantothenate kinase [Flaviaesturariibacter flavus]TCJ17006.1 type III pantothenate kinase [Flaviaesturariibacter flavus]
MNGNPTFCLDFGNTRLKLARFENDTLREVIFLREDALQHLRELLEQYRPARSILSSVVHHDPEIEVLLSAHTRFHKLSNTSRLAFTIPVGKPETMGADRLAVAAAAVDLFPGANNLAITLGTCITFNFINTKGEFLGGSISPGMEMRFRAMHEYTAKLPLVKGEWNVPLIGYDTATNLQSGVVLGMVHEIDGIIDSYAARFGNFNALLTGGDGPVLTPHLKNRIFADPELIFKGLYAISRVNTDF